MCNSNTGIVISLISIFGLSTSIYYNLRHSSFDFQQPIAKWLLVITLIGLFCKREILWFFVSYVSNSRKGVQNLT
jgi:hypothetical protein